MSSKVSWIVILDRDRVMSDLMQKNKDVIWKDDMGGKDSYVG